MIFFNKKFIKKFKKKTRIKRLYLTITCVIEYRISKGTNK